MTVSSGDVSVRAVDASKKKKPVRGRKDSALLRGPREEKSSEQDLCAFM